VIEVRYEKRSGHFRVEIDGHAETAPHGADIVCAGVSAVAQGLLVTIAAMALEHPNAIRMIENVEPPMHGFDPLQAGDAAIAGC
jgi:uncharacterized protein YsxB (DUF464 family)